MDKVRVRYIVNDVGAAIDFYSGFLGFKLDMHPAPGFAQLSNDNLILLLNRPGAGGAGQQMPDGRMPGPGGWNRIQIVVDDLVATAARLSLAGCRFRNDIVGGTGGKQILLEDPSGNPIELFEPGPARVQTTAIAGDAAKRIDHVNGWLKVGGALSPDEYERLAQAGVTHVVDLREERAADIERLKALGIRQTHMPVPDHGAPTVEELVNLSEVLRRSGDNTTTYVHCKGGFGRAATVAVGLLILRGTALDEAVAQVRTARPEMRLNDTQAAWLRVVAHHASRPED